MSPAENQALELRDLAVQVVKAKGVIISTNQPGDLYTYQDAHIRIEYNNGKPQAAELFKLGEMGSSDAKVLSVIWQDGGDGAGSVVVLHRTGSWEDSLRRLARGC